LARCKYIICRTNFDPEKKKDSDPNKNALPVFIVGELAKACVY
jgi:hypothetical protein